jgi:glycosyltransferase involved in cell wall biosynthesis
MAGRSRVVLHQQFVQVPFVELPFIAAARRLGIPCVLTPHDVTPYADASGSAALLPRLYRQYDALIAGSRYGKAELSAQLGEAGPEIHIIPLGHLNDAYPSGTLLSRETARERIGLGKNDAVVLFLGQIKREKGLEHLLRALHALPPRLPAARLLVAGRPYHDDIARYERLIDDLGIGARVQRRWEYVPDEEVAAYYRAADVIAVPYTRAYQSGVILTAYAFGRAVVASAAGGLVEQVVDGQTGWLVPPADPAALAQALTVALADRDRTDAIGARGHRWAAENFDWGDIARKTVAVYEAVALRRRRDRRSSA